MKVFGNSYIPFFLSIYFLILHYSFGSVSIKSISILFFSSSRVDCVQGWFSSYCISLPLYENMIYSIEIV